MKGLRQVAFYILLGAGGYPPRSAAAQDSAAATVATRIVSTVPWARYANDVTRLYGFGTPVWLEDLRLSTSGHAAIGTLLRAGEHGLDPRDYHADWLDSLARRSVRMPLSWIDRERLDALLSVNLIRFLDDLQFGRLHPATLDRSGSDVGIDLAAAIRDAIAGDSIPRLVAAAAPQLAQYRNLQHLLARYRPLAADPSLELVAKTSRLSPGDPYPDLVRLRRRLAAVGDLERDLAGDISPVYSHRDAAAVRRFQARHGLPSSGVLDSATVTEIDIPFTWRVRQIELALERLRWLPPIGRQRVVVVNIPAFQLFAFDSAGGTGAPALSMRVIVGNALDTRTPVLFKRMRYVEFRPYWYVPLGIAAKEILPQVRKDPGYLDRNEMEVVDRADSVLGRVAPPEIRERIAQGQLRLRQRPGVHNPLGLVKFVFPNSAAVYLHGTPRTELFNRTRRDFSHGCIRVEDPTALAAWVLQDRPRWDRASIRAAERGSVTIRAWLSRPMPVVVFYTTAVAAPDGSAWFHTDLYGHDRELDEALRAGPVSP